jgi:hypothetical protein
MAIQPLDDETDRASGASGAVYVADSDDNRIRIIQ